MIINQVNRTSGLSEASRSCTPGVDCCADIEACADTELMELEIELEPFQMKNVYPEVVDDRGFTVKHVEKPVLPQEDKRSGVVQKVRNFVRRVVDRVKAQ